MSRLSQSHSDYNPRALALLSDSSDEDDISTSIVNGRRSISPRWTRQRGSFASDRPPDFKARLMRSYGRLSKQALKQYNRLTILQKGLLVVAGLAILVAAILFLVYNERIYGWLAPFAKRWREIRAGWLILWAMTFVVSFPPLIGYSTCVTIAGFVYGFPNG